MNNERRQRVEQNNRDDGSNELISLLFSPKTSPALRESAVKILKGEAKPAIETEKYDSVKGICEYLAGCSRVHLWQLRKRGLPSHNIGGRLGFKRGEVDLWLAKQK
jgi:hypothetical protein